MNPPDKIDGIESKIDICRSSRSLKGQRGGSVIEKNVVSNISTLTKISCIYMIHTNITYIHDSYRFIFVFF